MLVDVPLGDVGVEIGAFDKPQEELVHDLKMRPSELKDRFVFFGIVGVSSRVNRRRDRSEQIGRKLCRITWVSSHVPPIQAP